MNRNEHLRCTTSDVTRHDYNEADALQQLMRAADAACEDSVERMTQHKDFSGQFTININGQSIAFHLGGPQIDGLYAFIEHIAAENFHEVNFNDMTVTAHLFK